MAKQQACRNRRQAHASSSSTRCADVSAHAAATSTPTPSTCQGCLTNCSVLVHADGRIEGNPANASTRGAICPNVLIAADQRTDPDRLTHPLRRTNPRKGRHEPARFERISWDEALDEIADHLLDLRKRGEGHRVAFAKGRSTGLGGLFMSSLPDIFGTPNRLTHDSICAEAEKLASGMLDGVFDYHDYDFDRAQVIILWGVDPLASNRMKSRFAADFAKLKRHATIVSISPNRNVTAQKAQRWLPVIPGTDGALACAMAHVILVEGLWNRSFVGDFACAPEGEAAAAGEAALAPASNSAASFTTCTRAAFRSGERLPEGAFAEKLAHGLVPWWNEVLKDATPDWAAPICGIEADEIRTLARQFAAGGARSISWISPGVTMTARGLYSGMACYALNGLVGSVGADGCVLRFPSVKTAKLPDTGPFLDDVARTANAQPTIDPRRSAGFAAAKNGKLGSYPVLNAVADALLDEHPYALDTLIAYWVNPAYSCSGAHRWEQALAKLPFFVHITTNLSESSMFADIVLPARHHLFEDWGFARSRMGGRHTVSLEQPCLESPGECRGDETDFPFDLAVKLAERGFDAPLRYLRSLVDPCTGRSPENGRELGEFACKIMLRPLWENASGKEADPMVAEAGEASDAKPEEHADEKRMGRKAAGTSLDDEGSASDEEKVAKATSDETRLQVMWEAFRTRGAWSSEPVGSCDSASASSASASSSSSASTQVSTLANPPLPAHAPTLSAPAFPTSTLSTSAFSTPTGRFEFLSERLRALIDAYARAHGFDQGEALASLGYEARGEAAYLAHYEEPLRLGNPEDYPLILSQHRSRVSLEGRSANTERFQKLKGTDPGDEPWDDVLKLHPRDMATLGLASGDAIRVVSEEGAITCHAKEWDGTRPGVAVKCYGQGHWAYGHVAALDFEHGIPRGGNNNEIIAAAYERVSSATARHGGLMRIRVEKI